MLGAALLAACGGGGDLLLPGSSDPATVTLLQGNGQNGRVGDPLPQPLVAEVTDAAGRPVAGATVVFVLMDPAPGASLTPDTTTTGADGTATSQAVLGTRPGAQTGEVRALGSQGQEAATAGFTLNAVPENANGIAPVSGDNQSAQVGATLPAPLVVQVADAFGNPIAGVDVAWSADGGGSVSSATTTTGADGQTSVTRTLGNTAGTQRTPRAWTGWWARRSPSSTRRPPARRPASPSFRATTRPGRSAPSCRSRSWCRSGTAAAMRCRVWQSPG